MLQQSITGLGIILFMAFNSWNLRLNSSVFAVSATCTNSMLVGLMQDVDLDETSIAIHSSKVLHMTKVILSCIVSRTFIM